MLPDITMSPLDVALFWIGWVLVAFAVCAFFHGAKSEDLPPFYNQEDEPSNELDAA